MSTPLTQFTDQVKNILIEKFDCHEDDFKNTELPFSKIIDDELDAVEFIMEIEKLYNVSIADEFFEQLFSYKFKNFCMVLHDHLKNPVLIETQNKTRNQFVEQSEPIKFQSPGISIIDEPTVVHAKVEDIDPNAYNVMRLAQGLAVMRSTWLCKTQNLGLHGNAFGGDLFCHLDEVSAAFVAEIIDTPLVVTVSANVQFKAFVKAGKLLKTYCSIKSIGNTSITINIEMRRYNVKTEKETLCVSAEMVFVRIDSDGEAIKIEQSVKEKYSNLVK